MHLDHDDAIDSRCRLCRSPDLPTPAEGERPAVDFVERGDGTRVYVCADHAGDLVRARAVVPEEYVATAEDVDDDETSETGDVMLPDWTLARLPDTPAADVCRECGRLTLRSHLAFSNNRCTICETAPTDSETVESQP